MVEAGQLAADVLHEARLVGAGRGERERDDELGDVVGPVLGEGEQQQGEAGPRVLVEPAEQPEVEEREPPVLGQQHVPVVRVGVVDALDHDLEHVGAEELAREEGGALRLEPVPRLDLAARDQLQDERALGHVRPDHARHDEPVERLDELAARAPCCAPPRRSRAPRGDGPRARPRAPRAGPAAPPPSGGPRGERSSAAPRGRARPARRLRAAAPWRRPPAPWRAARGASARSRRWRAAPGRG